MTLFDVHFSAVLEERERIGTRRVLSAVTRDGRFLVRDGKRLLDTSSNDYLGLADHPALRERAADWALRFGTGARASRLVSGTMEIHRQVEKKLLHSKIAKARFFSPQGGRQTHLSSPPSARSRLHGQEARRWFFQTA